MTYYVVDYFIFERVQLYTYDIIHEKLGFKMFWGGIMVYGWLYILPLWGIAALPHPGFSTAGTLVWLIAAFALFCVGWTITRGANLQKYTFKRWPDRKFLGIFEPTHIVAGDRKILTSGFWRPARHFNYLGEGYSPFHTAWRSATSPVPGRGRTSSSSSPYSPCGNAKTKRRAKRSTAPKSGRSTRRG